jgi:DNA replication protein DnaC
MNPTNDLVPVLKKLRMSGVLQTMSLRTKQAVDDNLPYEEFLFRLLADEVERREAKQLEMRLRRASFEQHRTLEDFDFTFNKDIPKAKVIDLATCAFIQRQENVLLVGPSGVGKSHVAQALGHHACRAGYSVTFTSAHRLFQELRAARADQSYDRRLLRFTGPDLLIVDDLGLRPLAHDEPEDLYELIRHRYERGSVIVTSNRSLEEWAPLFVDPLLASAALDRLLHHAHIIEMHGDSYRNPPRPRRASRTTAATSTDAKAGAQ